MRKHRQRQILELLETIKEAQAAGLYADCQDGALVIGEFIEDIEGEGTQTVALLEEYCELLFKAAGGEIGAKALNKHLIKVENSIKNELKPNRVEMVFLSYKASMSDSIESIYLAAKEDPDCDAYWIPIPYYEKNADGSLRVMHFEGAEHYDSRIECTGWQEYDFEARHPDAIFTFSPYDDENYVTSVHPDFYCKRLREHTDCLVYVPYFVVADDNFLDEFCLIAGCRYAHKVILQSESVRDKFLKIYTEAIGNILGDPKEKFIALGSPKFDKVINSKREDFELPDRWAKLIKEKKVILYNISIGAMLLGYEQYMKKLRHVLETFRDRDDVALWWRPHPLIETTLATMRPMYLTEYMQIVNDYIREGYGIFDDTPDLHRALTWTDAYYGDWSSLVTLYQAAGKPIIIQNIQSIDDNMDLCFESFVEDDGGRFWAYAYDVFHDGLFEIDMASRQASYRAQSGYTIMHMGMKRLMNRRYIKLHCSGDEVFCFPNTFDSILVYNKINDKTSLIPLDHRYLYTPDSHIFGLISTVEYHNEIYCFGSFSKAIVVFNTDTHCVSYHDIIYKHIGLTYAENKYVKTPSYIGKPSKDGRVTLLMRGCSDLMSYSLPAQEFDVIASNPILERCFLAEYDGQVYWLVTNRYDKLIKWNPDSNKTEEYDIIKAGFAIPDKKGVFTGIADCGEYLLLTAGLGNVSLRFDKDTGEFKDYRDMPIPVDEQNNIWKYTKPIDIGNKIYTCATFNRTIYELDKLSGEVIPYSFAPDADDYEVILSNYRRSLCENPGIIIAENGLGNIAEFFAGAVFHPEVQDLKQRGIIQVLSAVPDGTAGAAIYSEIKKVIAS